MIKPWQERITLPESKLDRFDCMKAEIDELRAALAAQPALVPMTEDEIMEVVRDKPFNSAIGFARAIEAHHGIGKSCTWTYDFEGYYNTACGQAFEITDGTPSENHMQYCYHCGGVLVVAEQKPPNEETL